MSFCSLLQESIQDPEIITVEATVASGFEQVALEECKEKIGVSSKPVIERGRVFLNISISKLSDIDNLRSVDNVLVLIKHDTYPNLGESPKEEAVETMKELFVHEQISKVVSVWSIKTKFKGILYPSSDQYDVARHVEDELKSAAMTLAKERCRSEMFGESSENTREKHLLLHEENKRTKIETSAEDCVSIVGNTVQTSVEDKRVRNETSAEDCECIVKNTAQTSAEDKRIKNETSAQTSAVEKETRNETSAEDCEIIVGNSEQTSAEDYESIVGNTAQTSPEDKKTRNENSEQGSENAAGKNVKMFEVEKRTRLNTLHLAAYNEIDSRNAEEKVLKFRVTCERVGKHQFDSEYAAYHVGGRLQDMFSWVVSLKFYDMEIRLNIRQDFVYYGIALTKVSKHHRNITAFGPTTLRATICYNLLHLANPEAGDIVIDAMCGGGSIPIEGALAFPESFYLCGDNHESAVTRLQTNAEHHRFNNQLSNLDAFSWDATYLPLQDGSIDICVTDLPFGKRSGSVFDNRMLYKKLLLELARVVRCKTGRTVLMTCDKKSIVKALLYTAALWSLKLKLKINMGGLDAGVFVLRRTEAAALMPPPVIKGRQARRNYKRFKCKKEKSSSMIEVKSVEEV